MGTDEAAPRGKLYPAAVVGIPYLKALPAVCPGLRTYPNGGFTADPAAARMWLAAGTTTVGISAGTFGDADAILAAVRA